MDFGSLYDAFQAMAKAGLSVEEVMEALEAELAETSPRSSISRPGPQEYKHQGPLPETRYGRPWSSWDSSGLASPLGQARGPPVRHKKGLSWIAVQLRPGSGCPYTSLMTLSIIS